MKYRLTDMVLETECGRVLHRIRALRDIPRHGVTTGDLGGWIESERNLAQSDNAWVSDDACVSGDAYVYGDAHVSGAARVYGDAYVSGAAQVSGDARVSDKARVYGNARITGNARLLSRNSVFTASYVGTENGVLTVTSGVSGLVVTRGCFTGSADEFLERSRTVHDDKTHNEYRMLIEVAKSRIPVHAVPDTEDQTTKPRDLGRGLR